MSEKCPFCGREVERAQVQCPRCGTMLVRKKESEETAKVCTGCGKKLEEGQQFCPECGTKNDMLYCSGCGLKKPE